MSEAKKRRRDQSDDEEDTMEMDIEEDEQSLDQVEPDDPSLSPPISPTLKSSPSKLRKQSNAVTGYDVGEEFVELGNDNLRRNPLASFDPETKNLAVQFLEADYVTERVDGGMRKPVIRIFGVTMEGNSVLAHVHEYLPYFYVPAWDGFSQKDLYALGDELNTVLLRGLNSKDNDLKKCVLRVDVVEKQGLWGYSGGEKKHFIRIFTAIPSLVATARRKMEDGISINHTTRRFQTYESNVPFVLRYMIDKDIRGGGWIEFPAKKYKVREKSSRISHCQIELDISQEHIVNHLPDGEWNKLAPLRILSFDIECAGRKGHFPKPEHDPVIQIASVLSIQGTTNKVIFKSVHTLKTCASISGCSILPYRTEEELLKSWLRLFLWADPDIVTGYNIMNFDFPYILDRAKTLKVKNFALFGRIKNQITNYKNTKLESKAFGKLENKEIGLSGRVLLDLLPMIRREYKLRSYSLNAVSAHFLNQQKEDVHHSIITDLQNGDDDTRRRLAAYCLKDALLPLRLLDKLMIVINQIEMARVTGVPLTLLSSRGQQIKVVSQLYRKANQDGFLIPVIAKQKVSEEKYEGATVIEPKRGFYPEPIATLDFASLYPSIMMAYNLCYTTLLTPAAAAKMNPEHIIKTPTGDFFVKQSVQPGLLPKILKELLEARSAAKRLMKDEKDALTKAVLDGRQLALKISANSVYGFTGAQVGQLPCLAISSSVTSYGREMIEQTKKLVEESFIVAKGYEHDAEVVYGDTDSVMIKFGTKNLSEAMRLGGIAAAEVSKHFPKPIKLEFEKVYFPYLLMNKKRYAGLYWTKTEKWDKLDAKGIETVRRDNCELVKDVVETCLQKILIENNVDGAIAYAQKVISDLLTNELDLSLLVISKSLGKSASAGDYDNKQAHVELAERMRKRDPSTAPVAGDRVPYVIIKSFKGAKAYEKAEDPIWVLENDIPIDTEYYLENQLKNPLTRIFEPILGSTSKVFAGDHMKRIKKSSGSTGGGIMKFAVKHDTCIGCKVPLGKNEKVLCKHCKPKQAEHYLKQLDKVREAEELYSKVWTQCQRCQGSLHQDVLCSSRDCPIFYRRKKVQKDLRDAQKSLDTFSF